VLTGEEVVAREFTSTPELRDALRAAGDLLGSASRPIDRLGCAVILAGSRDPLRDELSPSLAFSAGRTLIAAMVDALPTLAGSEPAPTASIAHRLWPKLSPLPPSEAELALLDTALVLCLDHDLAASTMAARVAASARAHVYAAVEAALGASDSQLHGSMSTAAGDMISEAMRTGHPERALADALGLHRTLPGFGHLIYRSRDPRAVALFERMHAIPRFHEVLRTVDRLDSIVASRAPRPANLDLALGALAIGAGMRRGSGQLIFTVGRAAGWIAHVVDEYQQEPLRLRPESRYTGVPPGPSAAGLAAAPPASLPFGGSLARLNS
jgi:citrate synthase